MNAQIQIGVHQDLPAWQYHALPGTSATQLRTLWQLTPAHLKVSLDEPREVTPAMMLGTLSHSVILEPDKPLPCVAIRPDCYNEDGRLHWGVESPENGWKAWSGNSKACKQWTKDTKASGLLPLKRDEYNAVFGMAKAVATHKLAGPMLTAGKPEVSLVTFSETHQINVRARVDFVGNGVDYLTDLKTTTDASPRAFEKKAAESGFHIQAALYLMLWNALAGADDHRTGFRFIVVEQTPPHAVNVFTASEAFLAKGRDEAARMLALYAKCHHANDWPAYAPELLTLELPRWAEEKI